MKIVIDIDEQTYNNIKNYRGVPYADSVDVGIEILKGTVLPKNYGRLIDADEILNHAHIEEDEDGDIFVKKWYCIEKDVFDNALVLIDGKVRKNERF